MHTMVIGGLAGVAGFVLLYTPLILDYRAGTLSDTHSLCASGLGAFARALNPTANSECGSVGNWYAFSMFLLWGGVAAAVGGLVWFLVRRSQQQPP